ncbi:aromatic-ring-hydroxylating dioxygenase subunit beta [Pseudomonas aeruginosa]|uniref:aromatic-ring-hydroxylating dioxygenase subunit beta n=1 Tax=Burkholderia cenocepacia TaxID=95486 RepID=UPI00222FA84D|nr:aromatic-ring-hydroxylating dioxygenase subunit beta [Burkholderia cenocepacia]MCW3662574.1 aromatic-ring-hydroxylating dioxygenase subunit beta [Burkholderia cenocepacia]
MAQQNMANEQELQGKAPRHEPLSHYVKPPFYEWLHAVSSDLGSGSIRQDQTPAELERRITRILNTEARLLDQRAFQTWIGLIAEECAYWIPASQPALDPRESITLEFHDRRRLLDRIARLDTGLAYSQLPASATSRQSSGLETWPSPVRSGDWHARYNFTIAESRNGHNRLLAGWNGFVLRELAGELRIVVKQINLIDSDRPQGNNSFFL